MLSEQGRSDIISIYYLAETAVIGLIVDCRPTATTPRDSFEQARTTEGNIVVGFFVSVSEEYLLSSIKPTVRKNTRIQAAVHGELFDRDDK